MAGMMLMATMIMCRDVGAVKREHKCRGESEREREREATETKTKIATVMMMTSRTSESSVRAR